VDNGARVINLSLGGQGYVGYSNEYDEAIKYAYSHGVVLVASAGNGDIDSNEEIGQDLDFIKASPACNDVDNINMVIGVGATKNGSTIRTNWTNYSNKYVDVFANGEDLVSTSVPAFSLINDEYARFLTGTSFAAPIVSASAALLIEKKPSAKVYEIINMIKQTNPFSINELLLNTPYTLQCKIKNTNKEVNNGDYILFEAQNLKSDINLTFKNNNNGNLKKLSGSDFEILDATKIRINTGNLSLSSGSYSILSDNCSIDGSITIKGEKIKEDKGSNCTLANIRQCDRKGLINLLTQILNSRKAM
jgi:subtilisin family serine protease